MCTCLIAPACPPPLRAPAEPAHVVVGSERPALQPPAVGVQRGGAHLRGTSSRGRDKLGWQELERKEQSQGAFKVLRGFRARPTRVRSTCVRLWWPGTRRALHRTPGSRIKAPQTCRADAPRGAPLTCRTVPAGVPSERSARPPRADSFQGAVNVRVIPGSELQGSADALTCERSPCCRFKALQRAEPTRTRTTLPASGISRRLQSVRTQLEATTSRGSFLMHLKSPLAAELAAPHDLSPARPPRACGCRPAPPPPCTACCTSSGCGPRTGRRPSARTGTCRRGAGAAPWQAGRTRGRSHLACRWT